MVSDLNSLGREHSSAKDVKFKDSLTKLQNILIALQAFEGNQHKKLNYEKLCAYLKLSTQEASDLLSVIFEFQKLFKHTFRQHRLQTKIISGNSYMVAVPDPSSPAIPSRIRITYENAKLLSDITYTFKHVNRGKGFNVDLATTDLLKNMKVLQKAHPYFFLKNGNNLTYPSELGLALGENILSYHKTHKKLSDMHINHYHIIFEEE